MADFCKQCSIELFGEDYRDLKGVSTRKLTKEEKSNDMGWPVICEGCGPTIVDDDGMCIKKDCLKEHGKHLGEPVLTAPITIGYTNFSKGVPMRIVNMSLSRHNNLYNKLKQEVGPKKLLELLNELEQDDNIKL